MGASRFHTFLIIALIYSPLQAQKYLPPEVISVENGLSSQYITSLTLDHNGYLWTGTRYGLNRFDGYQFRHFFTAKTGDESSDSQTILSIRCDNQGNLWILNQVGINRYDHKTGMLTRYTSASFDTVFQKETLLKDVCPGAGDDVWILTERAITQLFPGQHGKTFVIPPEQLKNSAIPTCLITDKSGNTWIGTTAGLLVFNQQQGAFQELMVQSSQGLLSNNHVNCLFLDQEGYLWIGTENGLNRLDPVDFNFNQFYPAGSSTAQPGNEVFGIASAENDELILTTGYGIVKFNSRLQSFVAVYTSRDIPVNAIAVDSSGNIWGGTSQGILKIRRSKLSVSNYTSQSSEYKLTGNQIVSLGRGVNGTLYVGFAGGSYDVINPKTRSGQNFRTLDGSEVANFYPFRQNETLILSGHDIEVVGPDQRGRRSLFSLFPYLRKDLAETVVMNCLFYDGLNNIWLGTSNGIQHINFDSARHVAKYALNFENQQISIGQVFDIEQDKSGNLWMGTNNGLLFYDPVRGNFSRYTPYDKNLMNTERKEVYTLTPGNPGTFWIGTSSGAFSFDIRSREFTAIIDNPVIMHSSIKVISVDPMRNIWIGTERGLYYYRSDMTSLMNYDQKDGLLNHTYKAILASPEGFVYLAGLQGLSVIKLSDLEPVSQPHNVVITGLTFIENEPTEESFYYQLSDTVDLPWNRKAIRIDFAVLDLARPEYNRFRYSFGKTGREPVWYQLGTQHYVVLDRLSPGKYKFRVTGCNSDMVWNNTGTELVIVVEAPFWRSKIMLIIYFAVGAFLVFMVIQFWIRQFFNLSRENQEREMFGKQIMLQKEELTLKNKSITDSINYAKRIQTAMLPPYKMFKSIFPSSFILFMPKDIVSGDFYWVNKLNDKIFIAAVDCTGHGVPGAFMSIIGFELFRKITNIEGLSRPSDILNRLNEDFHIIFKDVENVVLRDGMDVAFCSIDKKEMILEFSGAFNPLYLIRDNKITEIKGDRFAIGLDETNFMDQTFKNHIIPIQKGDIIYIFSDGFADQFGGPDGKKYKYRRFRHLLLTLHQLPMEKQHEILENNVIEWRGDQDQVDDILVIGIKVDF
jgi:ligand-binding sensor domain-containing protein/serine phosphatase RsbU (regulator of sigma subunit)